MAIVEPGAAASLLFRAQVGAVIAMLEGFEPDDVMGQATTATLVAAVLSARCRAKLPEVLRGFTQIYERERQELACQQQLADQSVKH